MNAFARRPAPLAAVFALVLTALPARAQKNELEGKPPDPFAPAHKAYGWKSKNDLRFVWWLPEGYETTKPRNLTVILHGTGLDYRWGLWNNKPGIFRPDDVVISVDGTTPDGEARLFLGEKKDAETFAAFLTEMRQTFAVDRVFLYGHSQGGFFTVYFAGEHPDLVAGVVAHASGAWGWSRTTKDVRRVAIAFMHGTGDPVVPYTQSPGARDAYEKAGFELLHLRRLDRYIHWPNAVRATETLDWCQGMTATDPAEALACALRILTKKKPDEYQWETLVGFSAARDVLKRLEGKGPAPFTDVPPKVEREAKEWIEAIEKEGAEHVAALRKVLPKGKKLELDGGEWLGHLLPLREDMRGVESVEKFLEEIRFDAQAEGQSKAVDALMRAWYEEKNPSKLYEAVIANLPKAFLADTLPLALGERMAEWKKDASRLGIQPATLKKHALFEDWEKGWKEGLEAYAKVWKKWKGPS